MDRFSTYTCNFHSINVNKAEGLPHGTSKFRVLRSSVRFEVPCGYRLAALYSLFMDRFSTYTYNFHSINVNKAEAIVQPIMFSLWYCELSELMFFILVKEEQINAQDLF